ncbi:hypothetical protein Trydic_g1069 [Trypoxylus dichotomus]
MCTSVKQANGTSIRSAASASLLSAAVPATQLLSDPWVLCGPEPTIQVKISSPGERTEHRSKTGETSDRCNFAASLLASESRANCRPKLVNIEVDNQKPAPEIAELYYFSSDVNVIRLARGC